MYIKSGFLYISPTLPALNNRLHCPEQLFKYPDLVLHFGVMFDQFIVLCFNAFYICIEQLDSGSLHVAHFLSSIGSHNLPFAPQGAKNDVFCLSSRQEDPHGCPSLLLANAQESEATTSGWKHLLFHRLGCSGLWCLHSRHSAGYGFFIFLLPSLQDTNSPSCPAAHHLHCVV